MVIDNRLELEIRESLKGPVELAEYTMADIRDGLEGARVFPRVSRERLIAVTSDVLALDVSSSNDANVRERNLRLVFIALTCVSKLKSDEAKGLEPKVSALTKCSDIWIKIEAGRILDGIKVHSTTSFSVRGKLDSKPVRNMRVRIASART